MDNDRNLVSAGAIGLLVILAVAALYAFNESVGLPIVKAVTDIGNFLFAAVCAVLCFRLLRVFDRGEVLWRVWLALGIGLGLWALAEAVYAFYEVILNIDTPYPSLADVVWVPGYIPLFAALVMRYRSLRVTPSAGMIASLAVVFLALAGVSLVFIISPMIASPDEGGLIVQVLNVLYPLGDLLVMFGALLIVMVLVGGQLSRAWLLIAAGCLLLTVADSLYSYGTWNTLYLPDGKINLLTGVSDVSYLGGYVVMAFGLYNEARLQRVA